MSSALGRVLRGAFMMIALPATVVAQQARVIAPLTGGNFLVVIGNDTLSALTKTKMQEFADSMSLIKRLHGEVALRDSLIGLHRSVRQQGDTLISRMKEYDVQLEKQVEGYRRLAELTEQYASRGRKLSIEFGAGGTQDGDPALIAGVAIYRLRGVGLFAEVQLRRFAWGKSPHLVSSATA